MLASILPSNTAHIEHAIEQVLASGKRRVGMLGLSFKAGTDDLRESPLVIMAERFIGKGLQLSIYDPQVNVARLIGANRRFIEESIPHIASVMTSDVAAAGARGRRAGRRDARRPKCWRRCRRTRARSSCCSTSRCCPIARRISAHYRGVCW